MTVDELRAIHARRMAESRDAARAVAVAAGDDPDIKTLVRLGLTARQAEIFLFVFNSALATGIQPTLREVGKRFSIAGPNGVMCHVKAIAKKGWWEQGEAWSSRSLKFLRKPDGSPFAGFCCR